MTDYGALVRALYDALVGWQEVADRCSTEEHTYSPGCFWNISEGKTQKPTLAVRKAILAGLADTPECVSLAVNASLVSCRRRNVSFTTPLWDDMQELRSELGEGWNDFGLGCLEARRKELGRDA